MATQEEKDAAAKAKADAAAGEGGGTQPSANEGEMVSVPSKVLGAIQEQLAKMESDLETERGARAALEAVVAESQGNDTTGEKKLRETKDYEPKFRTVRLRKFPIAGDPDNLGIVVGWTQRGSYQQKDTSGLTPANVDYIEVFFLGQEKTADGKLKAEKVRTLDLLNAPQIICKILETDRKEIKVPTNEEIDVSVFDPKHGMMATGEKVDGYFAQSEIKYTLQIPGHEEPVKIDALYCN